MFDISAAAVGRVVALLGAGGFGAGFADCFKREPRRLVGLGEIGFGLRQIVGGGAPLGRRRLDLRRSAIAVRLRIFPARVDNSARSFAASSAALLDGGDLRRGAVLAFIPGLALAGDGLQAMIGKLGLAGERLRLDPHFGAGARGRAR